MCDYSREHTRPAGATEISPFSAGARALRDHRGLERTTIADASLGGMIAGPAAEDATARCNDLLASCLDSR